MTYIQMGDDILKAIGENLKQTEKGVYANADGTFEDIYRLYAKKVYRFCLFRTNSYQDAEDITAETFIKLLREKGEKDKSSYILPWLLKVAANLSINHNQRSANRKRAEQAAYIRTGDLPDPWRDDEIWQAARKLKPKQQQVVYLRLAEDMSFDDVAKFFGMKEGAAKMFYYRTIKQLKCKLEKEKAHG